MEANGGVIDEGQFGVAEVEIGAAIENQAIYRLYSMTKPVVSMLALMLIEQGRLRLWQTTCEQPPTRCLNKILR
ncbi:MAG: serine hydrolase [Gammaproteobacteria bacterium]|nr:serine hydrolase [Gammaproteobacteria bacterium]MBT4492387.1 serine hydrolase [Gammaproteobacteria bacterium]MBT7370943.1 serine hydrolase [Gammaproteobacteria bacterium]